MKKYRKAEYVQRRVKSGIMQVVFMHAWSLVGSGVFEVVFIFEFTFIFEVVFIFEVICIFDVVFIF